MTSTDNANSAPHYLSLPDARTVTTQAVRAAATPSTTRSASRP
ncbi:hypothetical protein ACFQ3Z_00505 [Streptomyces nogalater]